MGAAASTARVLTDADGTAAAYARRLLDTLGARGAPITDVDDRHPALAWADSGLMALTGLRGGEPQMCPAPLASCADGALAALAALAAPGALTGLRGARLLGERAAIAGHSRNGATSPGGSCRLLDAADGALALNLAREDDWSLLPAWLEADVAADWDALARAVRGRGVAELVGRGRLLGLAVAAEVSPGACASWFEVAPCGGRAPGGGLSRPAAGPPLVIDLSSLWAGPLCGDLLRRLGARVVKVESVARPDGARRGPPAFFGLLNAGKACVALDFGTARGRAQLRALIERADIVIEASRPRALRQLGLDAERLVRERPGLTWLSITGYGRAPDVEDAVAYGDDAGVAAGLSGLMRAATGLPLIAGDAVADPLTGLHAALAAWAMHRGGGGLVSVALRDVVAQGLAFAMPSSPEALRLRQAEWTAMARAHGGAMRPRARGAHALARPAGADTHAVLRDLGIP